MAEWLLKLVRYRQWLEFHRLPIHANRLLAEMHLPKVERLEYRVHKQGHCEDEGAEDGQDARARACNRWSVEV